MWDYPLSKKIHLKEDVVSKLQCLFSLSHPLYSAIRRRDIEKEWLLRCKREGICGSRRLLSRLEASYFRVHRMTYFHESVNNSIDLNVQFNSKFIQEHRNFIILLTFAILRDVYSRKMLYDGYVTPEKREERKYSIAIFQRARTFLNDWR